MCRRREKGNNLQIVMCFFFFAIREQANDTTIDTWEINRSMWFRPGSLTHLV